MSDSFARTRREVQMAHDKLTAVVLGDVPVKLDHDADIAVRANLDVLCWLLGHDHNRTFATNQAALDEEFKALGATMIEAPMPVTRDDWNRRN